LNSGQRIVFSFKSAFKNISRKMSNISSEIIIISDDEEEMEQQDVQPTVNMNLWRGWNGELFYNWSILM